MAKYTLKQTVYEYYEIEAADMDAALEILYSGDIDPDKTDFKDVCLVDKEVENG